MARQGEPIRIGCTGWSIPATGSPHFPGVGSHLERYAQRFTAVEISSSFYRHHLPRTYARWAATVPADFRFAVKLPRAVTHEARLGPAGLPDLDRFLTEVGQLGDRLGPLLVQLPPSLAFDADRAASFFAALAARTDATVACEPRHPSWFTGAADALLTAAKVARVAADPAIMPEAAHPGGWAGLAYHRLHGSPVIYRSPYAASTLAAHAMTLANEAAAAPVWCFFDNTADGAAPLDALALIARLG
ncbi:MAG TPA: DUF72 domain-containing protein [Thermomicrobiales bacterium]|jgi:uncharacterized protein YecE (DUF72 family)